MMREPIISKRRRPSLNRGFTLVELLVAVAIGTVLVLAITIMLTRFEGGRRSLTNANDATLGSAFVTFELDRMLRNAGSGLTQGRKWNYGCQLSVARGADVLLPRPDAFPAPFAAVPQSLRLAPVMAFAGVGTNGSDVLAIFTGAGGVAESGLPVKTSSITATELRLGSTVGLKQGELILVWDDVNPCFVQQVGQDPASGGASETLQLGGTYAVPIIGSNDLKDMGNGTSWDRVFVSSLGRANGNQPQFLLVGVGENATLSVHDLLALSGDRNNVQPLAEGVYLMKVQYGISAVGASPTVVADWVNPNAAPWDSATLLNGSQASRDALGRILAVRVGLLIRSTLVEREAVSPADQRLFGATVKTLTADEQKFRWRAVELDVPLRNMQFASP